MTLPAGIQRVIAVLFLTACPAIHCLTEDDARAEACAEACYSAMHWEENCAVAKDCASLSPGERQNCHFQCVQESVECQLRCWDSYDIIKTSCQAQCLSDGETLDVCERPCVLERFRDGAVIVDPFFAG